MTKVEAIERVMRDNGGSASLKYIYDNIERYYPSAKRSANWQEGIRGVLYRELKFGTKFKKLGLSIYAIEDYKEEETKKINKVRRHSFMEGICIELGNEEKYDTYTADQSALYRDNTYLNDLASISDIPLFTYSEIIHQAKLIDVLWFNKAKLSFPQYAFEIVDSIGTLNGALNRCLQLQHFRTKFFIVAPEEYRKKYEQTLEMIVYQQARDLFSFLPYDQITESYDRLVKKNDSLSWIK